MNILLSFLKMQHCFFVLQRDAEVDDAITGFAQPQILIAGDIFDIDLIYIVAEGRIICQLPQKSILDALLGLLGSFYIFNVSYNQSKAILTFLEQALLEIGRGQTLVTVSSLFIEYSRPVIWYSGTKSPCWKGRMPWKKTNAGIYLS